MKTQEPEIVVAKIEADIQPIVSTAIEIRDQADYEHASIILSKVKAKYNEIEDIRKSITQPIDMAKKRIMELFRKPLEILSNFETTTKKTILVYMEKQERIRQEQEDKLRREAEKKRQEALAKAEAARADGKEDKAEKYEEKANGIIAPTLAPNIEQAKGQAIRIQWSAEVVDFKLLPDEYKLPNMPMLNKMAQATRGAVPILGIVFKSEKILASRI